MAGKETALRIEAGLVELFLPLAEKEVQKVCARLLGIAQHCFVRAGGGADAAHQRKDEREQRRGVLAHALDLLKRCTVGGKHRVERAEFLHQAVRDGIGVLPRHGVVKEKLEHLMVGERIESVGAKLLFFA